MNKENIKELIERAKKFASNEECMRLAESFEEFIDLYHSREEFSNDPEFGRRLEESNKRFWLSFDKAAGHFGISQETIKAQLLNAAIPQGHEEITIGEKIPSERKLRKNNNKVKI